ncbi:UDP-N-acetylmuramoyl-L-alanine--D-glutamate ligase [Candidatus Saccharibacteria bacterium]|nr:UDP-N-acetylmuramoyl-L-alanine--D-glutamate ligase [Candidatus Saccharibacteria bacterium]
MNIAVLGGGVEGTAVKKYFTERGDHVQIFDNFKDEDIKSFKLEDYDKVFRSPSVHPLDTSWTSITKYFFENCKAKIIGVTGTKGKGTTCSIIVSILKEIIKNSEWPTRDVYLVGNIGTPSLEVLDEISEDDIVVYEMSSFQLWDLEQSPNIAVVLRVEQDHLDRHYNLEDYHSAKANIARFQSETDCCIFYNNNENSKRIGNLGKGKKLTYPISRTKKVQEALNELQVPGEHNVENAEAALLAVASFFNQSLDELLENENIFESIKSGIKNFKGLPHRLEFVRELNGVRYYDDNFSAAFPATDVAIKTFENDPTILIAGGYDRHLDLSDYKTRLETARNLKKVILIGEIKTILAENSDPEKFELADSLEEAVEKARNYAEKIVEDTSSNYDLCLPVTKPAHPVVLMSPGAASFDMFKNFKDRGEKFQALVNNLK